MINNSKDVIKVIPNNANTLIKLLDKNGINSVGINSYNPSTLLLSTILLRS